MLFSQISVKYYRFLCLVFCTFSFLNGQIADLEATGGYIARVPGNDPDILFHQVDGYINANTEITVTVTWTGTGHLETPVGIRAGYNMFSPIITTWTVYLNNLGRPDTPGYPFTVVPTLLLGDDDTHTFGIEIDPAIYITNNAMTK